jgi:hypothetical protein
MTPETTDGSQPQKRPQLLTILLILTFLGSGIASLSYLMVYLSYDEVIPLLSEMEEQFPIGEYLSRASRNFYLTAFILYFFSLLGARLMWNLRKAGFHFYTGSQVMMILLPIVYISGFPFPIFDSIITGIFIFLYYRFYSIFSQ